MLSQNLQPSDRRGSHAIEAGELGLDLSGPLAARIRSRFASPSYQPPTLPAVATKLLELSRAPDTELRRICTVLEQDPLLAGKVLSRAQSPVYAGASPTHTLHDALVRLGFPAIRNLALEMACDATIFRAPAPAYDKPMTALRRHSLVVAYAARLVALHAAVDAEYAFLCGLLHDVGISAALLWSSAEPEAVRPSVDQLWPALTWIHEDLSGQVVGRWKLPLEVQLVVGKHHRIHSNGFAHPAIAVLRIAEGLAEELGAGLTSPDLAQGFPLEVPSPAEIEEASALLGVTPSLRDRLLCELQAMQSALLG